jgi:hypothetical protein
MSIFLTKVVDVMDTSKQLSSQSKEYKWGAKKLSFMVAALQCTLFVANDHCTGASKSIYSILAHSLRRANIFSGPVLFPLGSRVGDSCCQLCVDASLR